MKDSPSQVSISERDEELGAEATDPVRSVTPSRGNVKDKIQGDADHTYPILELGSSSVARDSLGAVITLVGMSQHCTVVVYKVISF